MNKNKMKTNQTRKANGQYGKSNSKVLKFAFILIIIGLFITAVLKHYRDASETPEIATQSEVRVDHELESIMNEEGFRKAVELKATKIKIERKKKEEMDRHAGAMKDIEVELEAIRKQELENPSGL